MANYFLVGIFMLVGGKLIGEVIPYSYSK